MITIPVQSEVFVCALGCFKRTVIIMEAVEVSSQRQALLSDKHTSDSRLSYGVNGCVACGLSAVAHSEGSVREGVEDRVKKYRGKDSRINR